MQVQKKWSIAPWLLPLILLGLACAPKRQAPTSSHELKIIGGQIAPLHTYPYVVSIYNWWERQHVCGGTLIAPRVVVTAAHCFADQWLVANRFAVRIGKTRMHVEEQGEESINIAKLIVHQGFKQGQFGLENDIALLILREESKHTPLALNRELGFPAANTLARVAGWGLGKETSTVAEPSLIEVDVPIVSNDVCRSRNFGITVNPEHICAGFIDGTSQKGPCHGDSGGPLFSSEQPPRLLGIVSNGIGCGRINKPSIYTRVSAYSAWIDSQLGQ